MADNVEVKLGADTAPATAGIAGAATSIDGSLNKVSSSLQKMSADAKTQTEKTAHSFSLLEAAIKTTVTTLAATFGIRESIRAYIDTEDAVRKLEISFGMTAEAATNLNVRLQLAGIGSEAYIAMAMRVSRMLSTQAEEFKRLGVATKDSSGAFLPMDEILQNIYKRMQDFKAGTDQNEFALATIGRSAKDFASDMERLGRTQAYANELIAKFGIEMGPGRQAEIENYRMRMAGFKIAIEELAAKIGELLIGPLENLATWLADRGPAAAKMFGNALINIVSSIELVATHQEKATRRAQAFDEIRLADTRFFHSMLEAITSGSLTKISGIWEAHSLEVRKIKLREQADLLGMEADFLKRMGKLGEENAPKPGAAPVPKSGSESFVPKVKGRAAADTRLAAWRDELVQMQEAEGYFHEFSKAQEAEFWVAKLALITGNGKQDVKLRQELNRMIFQDRKAAANEELQLVLATMQTEIDAAKENKDKQLQIASDRVSLMAATFGQESKQYQIALDQELKLREVWVRKEQEIMKLRTKMDEARATHEITMEQLNLDQQYSLRQVNLQQKLSIEASFEERLYQMKLAALQKEAAALQEGTKARIEVDAQIEALEMSHQERLTAIANEAERDRMQYAVAMQQAVENGFASLLSDLTSGTKKWKDAFLDAAKQIDRAITDLVAKKLAAQLFGGGTGGGDIVGSLAKMIFGAGLGGGGGGGGIGYGEAGSLMGDLGPVPYDVGTPYVPRDTLALVHKGEAIVPAKYNKAGGHGLAVTNHFHISGPVDSRTQDQIAAAAARGSQRAAYRIM